MMWDHISKYWIDYLCGVIAALLAGALARMKGWKSERKVTRAGLLALLHDRLYQACQFYIKRGWAGVEDKRNLEYMFRPYSAMGGNGICKRLYEECLELPIEDNKEDREK